MVLILEIVIWWIIISITSSLLHPMLPYIAQYIVMHYSVLPHISLYHPILQHWAITSYLALHRHQISYMRWIYRSKAEDEIITTKITDNPRGKILINILMHFSYTFNVYLQRGIYVFQNVLDQLCPEIIGNTHRSFKWVERNRTI